MLEFVLIIFVGKYIYALTTWINNTHNNNRVTIIEPLLLYVVPENPAYKKQGEDYRKNNNLNQD